MTVQIEKREIGNLVLENIPEIPESLNERLNHYHNTRDAYVADWLNNGRGLLISTRFGESAQLHIVEKPGATRKQVTFFPEPIFSASVCPAPGANGFLFAKDVGGNENYQLYYHNQNTGHYYLLTDGVSRHGSGLWNRQGTAIAYNSTKGNENDHALYLYTFGELPGERLAFKGEGYWYPVDWSPCGQMLTVINYRSINESFLYILDIRRGGLAPVLAKPNVACRGGYWSADGAALYFSSDEFSESLQLTRFRLRDKKQELLAPQLPWEVESMRLSPSGRQLAFVLNDNGISRLYFMDTATGEYQAFSGLPDGIISNLRWRPDGKQLAITADTPQAPADVYVINLRDSTTCRWTYSEVGGLDPCLFVKPELVHYPTFDLLGSQARNIPAFYFMPVKGKGPFPVLIYIHGGPESQYRPCFSPIIQYYLNELGIAVVAPNVRGSSGYGKHFLKLDNGFKREDSVRDIGKLLDWIDARPELDSARVAVIGGSYGGYMVLSSMAHFNGRLRCGVDIVGISNFVTFLENTKSYRRNLRRVEYGDERNPRMRRHLERISPTANAHKITRPILIVQGLNDPRVPASEAEQMLHAIRRNGGVAWYMLAKDEGHGFRKKPNRDYYNKAVILFLQRYLL